MKIGRRLLCLSLALLLAVSVLPISTLAAPGTSKEEAVNTVYDAMKEAIAAPGDGVNAALNGIAKLDFIEGSSGGIACDFLNKNKLAKDLIGSPFLAKLFEYENIESITFLDVNTASNYVTKYVDEHQTEVQKNFFVQMVSGAVALCGTPVPLSHNGNDDQLSLMLTVLASVTARYQGKIEEFAAKTTDVEISFLNGTQVPVTLNGEIDGTPFSAPVTIYFCNSDAKHNVTFTGDGVTEGGPTEYQYDAPIQFPAANNDGQILYGWKKTCTDYGDSNKEKKNVDCGVISAADASSEKMGALDVTYEAQWTSEAKDVKFHYEDDTSTTKTITQGVGMGWLLPETPKREGYTFLGWFTEKGDSGSKIGENYATENGTDIYAHWWKHPVVTFHNENARIHDTPVTSDSNGKVTQPTIYGKPGYEFLGWFESADGDGERIDLNTKEFTEDTTIYARFAGYTYSVEFKPGADDVEGTMESQSFTYDEPEKPLSLNQFTRKGYEFDGWSASGNKTYTDGQPVKNLTSLPITYTLTAKWKAKTYEVTLDAAGGKINGEDTDTITVTYDQTYGDQLTEPTREGYEFAGWQTAGGETVGQQTKVGEGLDVTAEVELKLIAQWNPKGDTKYTVKHWLQKVDGNEYELADNGEESKQGQTAADVTLTPREITGFHVNKTSSNDLKGTIGADGKTVMNIYYDRNTYQITWKYRDAEGNETSAEETYRYGATPARAGANVDTDSAHYEFKNWDSTPATVTGPATYTAQYTESHEARIGETTWRTLELALKNAKANDTVVLESDATLTDDVTVPEDVMLLLPVSAEDTGYDEKTTFNPDGTTYSQATGKDSKAQLFHKLTIPTGKTMTVNGTVLVNAVTGRPNAGHYDMDVTGGYGEIALEGDIVVKNGGILDVCGYVTGSGTVTAEPGGEVRDLYIVRNWRGGSQALHVFPNVYPMNQVDMHNIEVKTVIEAGASLVGTVKMYADSRYYYTRFPQIDQGNGLIRQSEGSVVKTYDKNNDREKLVMEGKGSIEASELFIVAMTLTTGDFVYPIDGDMDFELSGDWTVNERLKLMPGVNVDLKSGSLTFAEKTAKGNADMLTAIYDSFQPTDPFTDGTKYPDNRGEASLTLDGGTTTVVNSNFGGKILVADTATEKNPAKLSFAPGIETTVTTEEANGAGATPPRRTLTFKTTVGGTEIKAGTNYICYVENGETVVKPSNDVPEIEINYEYETLTGFADGHSYTINGTNAQPNGGSLAIEEGWYGSELKIVDVSGDVFLSSLPQTLAVPTRPEAPAGLRGMTPSTPEGTDGSITGLDSGKLYEYKLTDSEEWTDVAAESASITGLAVGTYQVRAKATADAFLSDAATVEVSYVAPYIPSVPDNTTETTTNPDGSTTTTTTAADGTVTETTEQVDGTVTEKVTEPDGSAVETTTTPEGVTGKVTTDAQGEVTAAEVVIPEAKDDEVVTAPVEVPAAKTSEEAPEISVKTGSEDTTKVEIPVTEFGPGTVAVVVHENGTEEVVRDCVISENGVVLNVEGDVTLKIVENSAEFNDIERVESWAGDAIEFTSARELFSGTGNNNFQPDGKMSRGALVTLLYRLSYEPDAPALKFGDVDESSIYADAVAWADSNSIVNGYGNGTFMPDNVITREQLVTLIYQYAQFKGVVKPNTGNINTFTDADKVSSYAKEAMAWAIGAGIVSGQGDNTLNPTGSTTRAQTAVILMKLCDYMAK